MERLDIGQALALFLIEDMFEVLGHRAQFLPFVHGKVCEKGPKRDRGCRGRRSGESE